MFLRTYSYFRLLFFTLFYFIDLVCLQFRAKFAICNCVYVVNFFLFIYFLLFVAIKYCPLFVAILLFYILFILLLSLTFLLLYLLFLLLYFLFLLFDPDLQLLLLLEPIFAKILLDSTTNNRIIIASHTHFLELSSKMLNNETM